MKSRRWNKVSILWTTTHSALTAYVDPAFHSLISLSFTNEIERPHIYCTYVCFGSFHIFASCLCATVHHKYLPYFGNYIKMKAIFVAISLHCFLLSFISAESINKNVFSFQQLILKTLIFKKTCKRICSPDDLLKEDKWGVKKYFSAYYHELKREICQLVYVSRNTRGF